MFGNYSRVIDDKNRILIPSKLREKLGNILFISIGQDNILEIRNEKDFSIWKDKLLSTNYLNKNARIFSRLILGNTYEIIIDKQSRISLPEKFLKKANILKDVTFVGVGNKVEIWSTSLFEEFNTEYSIETISKKLLKEGNQI